MREKGAGMNRTEALHTLGLDDEATPEDIKTAYKESAQILHPDRFATNRKLQDRATEQFKRLQEAYEYLTSGRGSKGPAASASRRTYAKGSEAYVEAQLAGLAAARTQLVSQRDAVYDERRNACVMIGLGALTALVLRRFLPAAGLASMFIIWGIVNFVGSLGNIRALNDNIQQIDLQRRQLEEQLEEDS